jgi:hypothetical protein
MPQPLKSGLLHRYWFPATFGIGVGVTAYELDEARTLAERTLHLLPTGASLGEAIVDVDVARLDQRHVIPNMGPCNFHGVWYPADAL